MKINGGGKKKATIEERKALKKRRKKKKKNSTNMRARISFGYDFGIVSLWSNSARFFFSPSAR